jgi:hypothetical protein
MTVEALDNLPNWGEAAMSEAQATWCRETIRFLQDKLSSEEREELGLRAAGRKCRKGLGGKKSSEPPTDEAVAKEEDDGLPVRPNGAGARRRTPSKTDPQAPRASTPAAAPSKAASTPSKAARTPKSPAGGERESPTLMLAQEYLEEASPRVNTGTSLTVIFSTLLFS